MSTVFFKLFDKFISTKIKSTDSNRYITDYHQLFTRLQARLIFSALQKDINIVTKSDEVEENVKYFLRIIKMCELKNNLKNYLTQSFIVSTFNFNYSNNYKVAPI